MSVRADYDEGDIVYIDMTGTWDPMSDAMPPNGVLFFGEGEAREIYEALDRLFNPKTHEPFDVV